jgi:coatomer subunit beta
MVRNSMTSEITLEILD